MMEHLESKYLNRKKDTNILLQIWRSSAYLRLSVYIVLTSVLLYSGYIFGDSVLAYGYGDWGYDTYHQYVPAYEFFADSIKNGTLSIYTFQYGLGTSTLSMTGWIADPFAMMNVFAGVLFGSEKIAEFVVYVKILELVCAGALTFYYLKNFKFSIKSSMLSAYIYAFSGFIMTAGQHYAFVIQPIYFIAILIALEKGIKKFTFWNFISIALITCVICLKGVGTAFLVMLGVVFYTIYRLISLHGKNFHKIFGIGISTAAAISVGILLSAVLFFPSIGTILSSSRLDDSSSVNILYFFGPASFEIIRSSFLRLFSNSLEGTVNFWSGQQYHWSMFSCYFSALLLPIIVQFVWKTFSSKTTVFKKVMRMLPIAALLFSIVFNFIPAFFNFFVYPIYYRYAFVWLPLFAVITAEVFDNIKKSVFNRSLNYGTMLVCCIIAFSGGYRIIEIGNKTAILPMILTIGFIIAGCCAMDVIYVTHKGTKPNKNNKKAYNLVYCLLACTVAMNMFCENYITLYYQRNPITKTRENANMITEEIVEQINDAEEDNFFRFETVYREGRMPDHAYSFLLPMRTVSFYNTVANAYLTEFNQKMLGIDNWYQQDYSALCSPTDNPTTEDILGIKYLLSGENYNSDEFEQIGNYNNLYLYQNTDIDSTGLLFKNYITEIDADKKTTAERYAGMGQRVVLDRSVDESFAAYTPDIKYDTVDALDCDNASVFMGEINKVTHLNDNSSSINIKTNTDTSLVIPVKTLSDNMSGRIVYSLSLNSEIPLNIICSYSGFDWIPVNDLNTASVGNGNTVYSFSVPQNVLYIGIQINYNGDVQIDASSQVITEKEYTANGVHLKNPNFGGEITGTVEAESDSILFVPIPYETNWTARVDGIKVEIIKANYAFCAIKVPQGTHSVTFHYSNSWFNIGMTVSIITLIVMIVVVVFVYSSKYDNKNNEEEIHDII